MSPTCTAGDLTFQVPGITTESAALVVALSKLAV